MENSQSKAIFQGFALGFFLLLLVMAFTLFHKAENVQDAKQKAEMEHNSLIIAHEEVADEGKDVYLGETGGTAFKTVTGDGDVVSKASLYTDMLNLPTYIKEVHVDGKKYMNVKKGNEYIDGSLNIAYLLENGKTDKLYEEIKGRGASTFIRTYLTKGHDDGGDIYGIRYTTKMD